MARKQRSTPDPLRGSVPAKAISKPPTLAEVHQHTDPEGVVAADSGRVEYSSDIVRASAKAAVVANTTRYSTEA